MTSKITYDQYIFRFGKHINMKAYDVARLIKVDKHGKDVNVGMQYLEFLVDKCDWFRHKDIIKQVIDDAKKNIKEPEDENKDVIKKKKNTDTKKSVKIDGQQVVNFEQ